MIVLKVKIYNNRQILIPNCGVLDSVIAQVRETEKLVLLDILSLSSPIMFVVLSLDLLISIHHQGYDGKFLAAMSSSRNDDVTKSVCLSVCV